MDTRSTSQPPQNYLYPTINTSSTIIPMYPAEVSTMSVSYDSTRLLGFFQTSKKLENKNKIQSMIGAALILARLTGSWQIRICNDNQVIS